MSNISIPSSSDEKVILTMINLSVIMLGTLGIILNGFSLHVLWKCMTTGQLGIKLVLVSDLVVCVVYVVSNIQNNIANSITSDFLRIKQLVAISRLSIHISLFVSNWWIIALLVLRILTIFSPKNINSWNKMIYHKVVYGFCWIAAIVIIVPLRFHEQYTRLIICVVPVVLVSLEAGLIIYGIMRVKQSQMPSNVKTIKNSYQEVPCSSSTSSTYIKIQPTVNIQPPSKYTKPYNNIVLTILALALNYLILDCLQFIDALYSICTLGKNQLPMWFMFLINIFSLLKRIFNFVILCAKCRYFRKIMHLKINIISRHFQRNHLKKRNPSNHLFEKINEPWKGINRCTDCQKPVLFVKENEFVSESNLLGRLIETAPFPLKGLSNKNDIKKPENCAVNSYYSAFEVLPYMSQVSHQSNNQVLSTRY